MVYCLFMICLSLCSPWEIGINAHTIVFFSAWIILIFFCEYGFIIFLNKYIVIHFVPYFFMKKIDYNSMCEHSQLLETKRWHFSTKRETLTLSICGGIYTLSTTNNKLVKSLIKSKNTGDGETTEKG